MKDNYWIIYTLQLEDDNYYVGSTTTLAFKKRMKDHWAGIDGGIKGSLWTRTHHPIMVQDIDVYPRSLSGSDICKIEDKRTLQLAKTVGHHKVRGGGYCQMQPVWPLSRKAANKNSKKTKPWERMSQRAQKQLARSAKLI